ncbi:uncharacterized protein LOC133195441 [Saccostrea echinata]|uniref:uncharacterized protein LOC133195441 n=1 Tax=Saccostrea echinata TaxID=191078 RepID=UPI002A818F44|nr:uncharacterized protein LOC133195441 [Saccostrea echinata]
MTDSGKRKDLYTIRDVTHDFIVTVHGRGQVLLIGLGVDGNIRAVPTHNSSADGICVSLLQLTLTENGGMVLGPINLDLSCTLNSEDLTGEINLISGVPIEVADRTLRIYQGGIPSRKLPPTPGITVKSSPPPKPKRDGETILEVEKEKEKTPVPFIDPELLTNIKSTDKLADLAASFLTKQINQYTDTKLSSAITDQIFSFLQEVAGYQRAVIVAYITEISQTLEEMPESERDRPLHKPSVRLLVELLRQIMDPLSHVVLSLQLLRTFSHFSDNLVVMVNCQAAPAVLGCMAVYLDVTEIQQYGLDILARIATYRPRPAEKIPLRETALEMILRSIQRHQKNILIVPPGCRTLVNLTCSLQENLDNFLSTDTESSPEVEEAVERYDALLRHIFQHAVPVIQSVLQEYPNNLDVKTEGRRFLYNYSKMTQFMQKKKLQALSKSTRDEESHELTETLTTPKMFVSNDQEEEPAGILKKTEEKGYMAALDRKVHFADKEPLDSMTSSEDEEESDLDLQTPEVKARLEVQETVILSEEAVEALRLKSASSQETGNNSENDSQIESVQMRRKKSEGDKTLERRYTSEMKINVSGRGEIQEVVAKCGQTDITIATNPTLSNPVSIFCPTVNCRGHVRNSEPICQPDPMFDVNDIPAGENEDTNRNNDGSSKVCSINECQTNKLSEYGRKEDNGVLDQSLQESSDTSKTQSPIPQDTNNTGSPNPQDMSKTQSPNPQDTSKTQSPYPQDTSKTQSPNPQDTSKTQSPNPQDTSKTLSLISQDSTEEEDYVPMDWSRTNGLGTQENGQTCEDEVQLRKNKSGQESGVLRYSVSDVSLCTKVIRAQVTHHISSLVFEGKDAQALSVIDKPLHSLLEVSGAPQGLQAYVKSQYNDSKTLMDLDTAFLISTIDAIRYRSLFHDLVQKSVLEVMNCMFGKYSLDVLKVALTCLTSVFQNQHILSLLSEPIFLQEVKGVISKLSGVLQTDIPAIQELHTVVNDIIPIE